jgi:hypothetical protein
MKKIFSDKYLDIAFLKNHIRLKTKNKVKDHFLNINLIRKNLPFRI